MLKGKTALVTGSKILSERLNAILKACVNCEADGDGCFDVEAYEHAIRLWTVVLEIAVTMFIWPTLPQSMRPQAR